MNVRVLAIIALIGVKVLFAADVSQVTTAVVVQQALQESAGKQKVFKTIMNAVNRYREVQVCAGLLRRCGLQYAMNNYGGKKNPRGKKMTKFLSQLPPGQKITFLAPLSDGLLPVINKIRAAEDKGDSAGLKTALADALTLLQAHIIKGEFTKDSLKGQMDTLGGTKINMDNLQFYQADVKTGNGVFHIIRGLATDVPNKASADAASSAVPAPAGSPSDKPADVSTKSADGEKPVDKDGDAQANAAKSVDSSTASTTKAIDATPAVKADKPDAAAKDATEKTVEPAKQVDSAAVASATPVVNEKKDNAVANDATAVKVADSTSK